MHRLLPNLPMNPDTHKAARRWHCGELDFVGNGVELTTRKRDRIATPCLSPSFEGDGRSARQGVSLHGLGKDTISRAPASSREAADLACRKVALPEG